MPSICSSCHNLFKLRLQARISLLQLQRRGFHSTLPLTTNTVSKGSYISSSYIDTIPPTADQLHIATHFFSTHVPTKSWTASEWRKHISQHSSDLSQIVPEIAFLGRSNSGKSSLLNALLQAPGLCRVGPRPGKTITMHAWTLSLAEPEVKTKKNTGIGREPRMTVLDMPGYGHGSQNEWGLEILKYIKRRRQLRRAFILLNPKHGIKTSDEQILKVLRSQGIAYQIIACKCDEVKASELETKLGALRDKVTTSAQEQQELGLALSDVLAVGHLGDGKANHKVNTKSMKGVENVQWAMLQAAGLERYAMDHYTESQMIKEDKRPLRMIMPTLTRSASAGTSEPP